MKIAIYQIDPERDLHRVLFQSFDNLQKLHLDVNSQIYDLVFYGEVNCETLEDIYRKFNIDHPTGYNGRSLSVSDVVRIFEEDGSSYYSYCDTIGFVDIEFDPGCVGGMISACIICRKRSECLESVQAHKKSDECFEQEENIVNG